jgi:hypothetical protein
MGIMFFGGNNPQIPKAQAVGIGVTDVTSGDHYLNVPVKLRNQPLQVLHDAPPVRSSLIQGIQKEGQLALFRLAANIFRQ